MTSTRTFRTSDGAEFKSATARDLIVVDVRDGEIITRTDDPSRARKVASKNRHHVVARRVTAPVAPRPSRNDPDFLIETHRCDRPQDLLPGQG